MILFLVEKRCEWAGVAVRRAVTMPSSFPFCHFPAASAHQAKTLPLVSFVPSCPPSMGKAMKAPLPPLLPPRMPIQVTLLHLSIRLHDDTMIMIPTTLTIAEGTPMPRIQALPGFMITIAHTTRTVSLAFFRDLVQVNQPDLALQLLRIPILTLIFLRRAMHHLQNH